MLALEAMSSVRPLHALATPVVARVAGVPKFRQFTLGCRCMASQPRAQPVAATLSSSMHCSGWPWQLLRPAQEASATPGQSTTTVLRRWAHTTSSLRDDDDAAGGTGSVLQDNKWPYRDRNITVTTCADLYKSWRGTRRGYSSAPTNGLPVPVSFVHTGLDRSERAGPTPAAQTESRPSRRPVVVILTGAPGSYTDFVHLIPFLDRHGVDVVAPAWPDLAFSRQSGCWWHSSEEKTNLALDFLRAVGVTEADMLVAHSSGAYPAMRLICREDGLKVKSLTLLAPAGYSQINVMRPGWFTSLLSRLYQQPLTQRMVNALALAFLVATRHPLRRDVDNVLLAMKAMLYADKAQFKKDAEEVAARKLPVLVAISDNDKLIDLPVSLETVGILGGSPESTWHYDQEKRLKKRGNGNGPVKTLRFEKGTHYLFTRCADVINDEILDLLKRTSKL
ncbi:hypothetical protein MTO96_048209 [Rhipicephalus appendiculatus]|uniref:Hydrolase/acyltransferase n=1 Tax=Rhipicephalus appendiculatus TaxID=34631 RepID=A0A131YNY2_RHIAP